MITIDSLARELDVTPATITVLVDQIADDADLWEPEAQLLTAAGAEIIRDQVTSNVIDMGNTLSAVRDALIVLVEARDAANEAEQGYRAAIRAAVDKGHPRFRVAIYAAISAQRVGQIYDGHR